MIITKHQLSRIVVGLCVLLAVLEVQGPCDAKPATARVRFPAKSECPLCNSECVERLVDQLCNCMCHRQSSTTVAPTTKPTTVSTTRLPETTTNPPPPPAPATTQRPIEEQKVVYVGRPEQAQIQIPIASVRSYQPQEHLYRIVEVNPSVPNQPFISGESAYLEYVQTPDLPMRVNINAFQQEQEERKFAYAGAPQQKSIELPNNDISRITTTTEVPAVIKEIQEVDIPEIVEKKSEQPTTPKCEEPNCQCERCCPHHDCNCGHRCNCYCGCGCGGPRTMCRRSLEAPEQVNYEGLESLSPMVLGDYGDGYVRQARSDLAALASLANEFEPIQDPRMYFYLTDESGSGQQSSVGSSLYSKPRDMLYRPVRDLARTPGYFPYDPLYMYQFQPDFSFDEMSYPGTSPMMMVPIAIGQQVDQKIPTPKDNTEASASDNNIKREEAVAVPAEPAAEAVKEQIEQVAEQIPEIVQAEVEKIKAEEALVTPSPVVTEETKFGENPSVTVDAVSTS